SGVFYFRLIVPRDLQAVFGKKVIKRSLGVRDLRLARLYAYELGAQYAHAIAEARGNGMSRKEWQVSKFDIEQQADGGISIHTDGTEQDNTAALEALRLLQAVRPASPFSFPAAVLADRRSRPPISTAPTLLEAFKRYQAAEQADMKPDTWEQRERAIRSFMEALGSSRPVNQVTRQESAEWAAAVQAGGISKRTTAMMVSHVAQLFEAQIRFGHIKGKNPVKGVVIFTKAEKLAAKNRGHGWEAFDDQQLARIFDPVNFARLTTTHTRWGALIGVYSGARVSEVAQLFLRDFEVVEGTKCVRITNESDGQSVKNEASKRLVPLHPDLLEMGLWDYVERLRAQGEERLFPGMRIDSKSGAGNAISKGFRYLIHEVLEMKPRRAKGKIAFHSLRKSVIQRLQKNLPGERRKALVGHEAGDGVHEAFYMRPWTADELATFFPETRTAEKCHGEIARRKGCSVSDWFDKDIASMELSEPEKNGLQFFRNFEKAITKRRVETFVAEVSWDPEVIPAFEQFTSLMVEEDERSLAVIACAYADDLLKDMFLRELPRYVPGGPKDLVTGYGPLANFSSRVKLAFAFGWGSEDVLGELDLIRKLRNDISHKWRTSEFEAKLIDLVENRQSPIENMLDDAKHFPNGLGELTRQQRLRLWVPALKARLRPFHVLYSDTPPKLLGAMGDGQGRSDLQNDLGRSAKPGASLGHYERPIDQDGIGQHGVQDLFVGHPGFAQAELGERRALFAGGLPRGQAAGSDQPNQGGPIGWCDQVFDHRGLDANMAQQR
ncbi:hypothetical protein KCV01_g1152, partial [Aureobasidium melanogenum]